MPTTRPATPPRYQETLPEVFVPRAAISPALLAAEAGTLGWDVVHALRLPEANATLAASERWPTSFDHEVQEGWRIAGEFHAWQLVRGGSNSILFLRAPLATASMSLPNVPDLSFTGGWVTVSVKLNYLPQPPAPAETAHRAPPDRDGGERQYLTARTTSANPDDPPAVVQAVDYGNGTPTDLQKATFRAAIGRWFCTHLDLLTYVFCALDLNARSAQGDFQWLRPTWTGYAYANGPTDETSCFGVLTMTSGNDPGGRINQLTPAAVPPGCTAATLISQETFLEHLMIPGLTRALPGTAVPDFVLDSGTVRATRQLALDPVESGGITYHPVLDDLRLQVVGDELQLRTLVRTQVVPGVTAFVEACDWYRITLVTRHDGGRTLSFTRSRPPRRRDYTETERWVEITKAIITVVAAIAMVVAGIVIPGAGAAIVAVLVIGLVAGIAAATPDLIALVAGGAAADALPSIGDLLTQSTVDIHWPESSGLHLLSAELNGSLQLGGTLVPIREARP
ncbi:TULIP family P47-like protein [Myceligenerans salitolerans]|uniref:TULIP family P47-like protein n=1 Tax=Myceligenerans salitolerans TaxID=1230528 RepID=A0ABS3ID44_9MICO|nr:TULIP family P47-like protein [Myceligenerans salitolerans]MBO0610348.1 TULIP family P47-like protein [Myceligenerans salitolerans]